VTRAEELVLGGLPFVAVIAGVVLLLSQCSDPTADAEPRSTEGAQLLIASLVPAKYRVGDCQLVRELAFPDDEFSCLISGRCNKRLSFAVPRADLLSSSPRARAITRAAPRCP
jgi:hypothetical protein